MKASLACILLAISGGACTQGDDDETIDVIVGDGKADSSSTVHVSSGKTVTVKFTASGDPLDVSVDCGAPSNVDTAGMQITVTSAALGQSTASAAAAGYWQWSGDVEAGQQQLKVRGKSGSGSCRVQVSTASGSCTDSATFRSPATGHTHITVGTMLESWGSFPVSGNHWGAWAKWNTVYKRPIQRGFLLHNLEHGGIVLSYNCSSPSESAACGKAASDLEALKQTFGERRVIVTPDPKQSTRYAARAWRMGFQASCFDQDRMLAFMNDNYRNGREDEDSDPPIPYDPTTLDVPCQDLMAAPDSCN